MKSDAIAAVDVAEAWKNAEYRNTLNADQLAMIPAHPAGIAELSEEELLAASGGATPLIAYSAGALISAAGGGASVYLATRK